MLESFVIVVRSSWVKWYLLKQKCQGGAQQSALSRALPVTGCPQSEVVLQEVCFYPEVVKSVSCIVIQIAHSLTFPTETCNPPGADVPVQFA